MPELPEVETVRRGLSELVVGKTIDHVSVFWPKIIHSPLATFESVLPGLTIARIDRRGKYLLFRLSNAWTLVSHLRMEGKYHLDLKIPAAFSKHTHVTFFFTDYTVLEYRDVRKFGRMDLVKTGQELALPGLSKLGPEPTAEDFKVADFTQKLARHAKPIKSVLLDQQVVAGLGNIYADEVLWLSKIHPLRPANSLTAVEIKRLHDAIIQELATAIEAGGTTIRSYVDAKGNAGTFQLSLHAYGEEGKPCSRCGTIIEKIVVGQRGTHFCPHCQQLKATV